MQKLMFWSNVPIHIVVMVTKRRYVFAASCRVINELNETKVAERALNTDRLHSVGKREKITNKYASLIHRTKT
jgi:hypothetical protein